MSESKNTSMFSKENYIWMLVGLIVIALGMFLMSGGKSNTDPAVFKFIVLSGLPWLRS
jgi:Protein of unknown function (DUF3098)